MVLTVIEIEDLCGPEATIYSILEENEELTFFHKFLEENENDHPDEVNKILDRLASIAFDVGAREHFFRFEKGNNKMSHLKENVCDIRVAPERILRLYCIRMSKQVLIVGGGGPKFVRAIQEDPKLMQENYVLRFISKEIYSRLLPPDKEIRYSSDDLKLIGNLTFDYEPR